MVFISVEEKRTDLNKSKPLTAVQCTFAGAQAVRWKADMVLMTLLQLRLANKTRSKWLVEHSQIDRTKKP